MHKSLGLGLEITGKDNMKNFLLVLETIQGQ